MNDQIVVGIDIGTTKVCAVVAEPDKVNPDNINILGIGIAESDGLNRGVVVNIDKTVASVQKAISEAERAADVEVKSVVVGIAGDHIQSFQSRGVITIAKQEISREDVSRLLEDTMRVAIPQDREKLHILPQEYIVDGQDGVLDPVGMSGVRLEANVHIITGLVNAAKNIERCIQKAGYQVTDLVLEPLASSFSVLHRDEKEVGVVLIDIGGGTTDVAVFEDGRVRHTAVIAVAGNHVTEDIRKLIGMMRHDAEQLKCRYGNADQDLIEEDEQIPIPGLGGREAKTITSSALAQIIQPRMEEIMEIAAIEIRRSGCRDQLPGGAVLTGGGSMIPGTVELANKKLGLEARIGFPTKRGGGLWEEVADPKYATGIGLVLYGLDPHMKNSVSQEGAVRRHLFGVTNSSAKGDSSWNKITSRMKRWFDEF